MLRWSRRYLRLAMSSPALAPPHERLGPPEVRPGGVTPRAPASPARSTARPAHLRLPASAGLPAPAGRFIARASVLKCPLRPIETAAILSARPVAGGSANGFAETPPLQSSAHRWRRDDTLFRGAILKTRSPPCRTRCKRCPGHCSAMNCLASLSSASTTVAAGVAQGQSTAFVKHHDCRIPGFFRGFCVFGDTSCPWRTLSTGVRPGVSVIPRNGTYLGGSLARRWSGARPRHIFAITSRLPPRPTSGPRTGRRRRQR
jgi:hypothetical protein